MEIRPLTPDLLGDFLSFFDGPAFADNPGWSGCYCMFFHFSGTNDQWEDSPAAENRAAKSKLIACGEARGYIAYEQGAPIGWVNAAPRAALPKLDAFAPTSDTEHIGNIVCFVVASGHRKQGVASALLEAATRGFKERGLTVAEAFPPKRAEGDAHNFRGPLSLYQDAGFTIARELENHYVVRRLL